MVFIALTFGVLIFSYQKLYGYRLGFRWKIINFNEVFDAFTFGVSTRTRPAAHHRDVDPLNPQARLWSSGSTTCESPWKDSRSRAWVRIPRAALFRDLIMRLRKSWKIEKNDQNQRKFIFYFSELRGRGKSSARISKVKLTHLHILFFFRNLKMRLRHASFRNFHKKSTSKYMNRNKPYQKNGLFSKFWKIYDDVKATQSIFKGYNLAEPGLAGRRFLVLIIKVTLSELSEASAPSMKK